MLIKNPSKDAKTKRCHLKQWKGYNAIVFSPQYLKDHYATLRMIENNWNYTSQFEVINHA